MGNELVKEVKSSTIVNFKIILYQSTRTVGQSIEGIIQNGKRYDKECKINSTLRQNDIRGKSTSYYNPDIKSEETITRFQYRSIPEL